MVSANRKIIFHEHHFTGFYLSLSHKVQEKTEYVFSLIRTVHRIPSKFLKHLEGTDGLYEIRVEYRSDIYRIFCCFDEDNLVVLFNGFQKKTEKTPSNELIKAERLKKEYFEKKKKYEK